MTEKIHIFDTTLRDGEQSAGVAFRAHEKLEIARALAGLGVDVVEAGFPCTSQGDFEAVQSVATHVREPSICALARALPRDVDIAAEALEKAENPRIHVFINSSDIQMAHQLRKGKDDVLEQAVAMVRRARDRCADVEFSPMDATRSDLDFLCAIVERTIDAGASVINIPDSVGYAIPAEVGVLFDRLRERVPNIHRCRLSFHGQNDLGMCTANAIAAVQHGARQVEVTINGIGERAGNTSLEEVVMAIHTRHDLLPFRTQIDTRKLWPTSQLVERLSGMHVQFNKAIVGRNAFRHGSGIHQDGILKMRETWEIMNPIDIGVPGGTQLVLGKLCGRHAFSARVAELGFDAEDPGMERAFSAFKNMADDKAQLEEADLITVLNKAGVRRAARSMGGAA